MPALDKLLTEQNSLLKELKMNIREPLFHMEQKANRKGCKVEFEMGDLVLVQLQPYRQILMARRLSQKLAWCYYRLFTVAEWIGVVPYWLILPPDSKIYPTFHVSTLKPYHGSKDIVHSSLPSDARGGKPLSVPLAICDSRHVMWNGVVDEQYINIFSRFFLYDKEVIFFFSPPLSSFFPFPFPSVYFFARSLPSLEECIRYIPKFDVSYPFYISLYPMPIYVGETSPIFVWLYWKRYWKYQRKS